MKYSNKMKSKTWKYFFSNQTNAHGHSPEQTVKSKQYF